MPKKKSCYGYIAVNNIVVKPIRKKLVKSRDDETSKQEKG